MHTVHAHTLVAVFTRALEYRIRTCIRMETIRYTHRRGPAVLYPRDITYVTAPSAFTTGVEHAAIYCAWKSSESDFIERVL